MPENKYRAIKTTVDGVEFSSKMEANRYRELLILQRCGEISCLEMHPPFDLVVNGVKVGKYTADFSYLDNKIKRYVVEEVKGYVARDYPLRRNLFRSLYPTIEHREITKSKKRKVKA